MTYKTRVVDAQINRYLKSFGGVVLEGPRGCGKTFSGLNAAHSSIRFDADPQLVETAEMTPSLLLRGDTPRLLDEWQLAPRIWNAVRNEIDTRQAKGQFILSGSARPSDEQTRHTGIGRLAFVRMRPMSLYEFGLSSGEISLGGLLSDFRQNRNTTIQAINPLDYETLAAAACLSCWPSMLGMQVDDGLEYSAQQINHICREHEANSPSAAMRINRLFTALARRTSEPEVLTKLAAEVGSGSPVKPETVRNDLDALQRVFIYEPLFPWAVALRSRSRLATTPTIHFADPGLGLAARGASVEKLLLQPEFFGQIFESMAVRDLRIYAQESGGQVFYYHDHSGLEVDIILEFRDCWAALEVKLGAKAIPSAEANLRKLAQRVDADVAGKPAFLAILTNTPAAYTLNSGIHIIPLATLGP